jgi:F420-non-reducing hydrogenase large subunit
MTDIMHHLGLAQEAAAILGGRSDHPLSAVAGGVSRFLKEGWYQRLEEIAAACKAFAPEWAAFFREELLREEFLYETAGGAEIPALDGLTLDEMDGGAALNAGSGNEIKIPLEELEEQIAVKTESWSRDGFAYRADRGWQGVDPRRAESFFCVGPPARWKARAAAVSEFPSGEAVASEGTAAPADDTLSQLSMTEYRRMKEIVAPAKPFSIPAVYAALAVELVEAAERMEELFAEEKLVGAVPRRIPQGLERRETRAALEAPEGFIYHRYRVNRRGIVEEVRVLDADTENNALRCFIADSLVRAAAEKGLSEADRKRLLEIGLAPIG